MKRRVFLECMAAQAAVLGLSGQASLRGAKPRVAVIGGGVFGVWTAWYALQAGTDVTLIDAWQPGHSRASSGGETRQWHQDYSNPAYAALAAQAKQLWHHWEQQWNTTLFYRTGRLMMASERGKDQALTAHERIRKAGLASETLSPAELQKRWPQINMADVALGVYMADIGLLAARRAVAEVAAQFQAAGGRLKIAKAMPGQAKNDQLISLRSNGEDSLKADHFVFACGPWLPKLFPQVLGTKLRPVRRDVFFVGPPAGDPRLSFPNLPNWSYRGAPDESDFRTWYGFPSFEGRGMKLCPMNETNSYDPDGDSRRITPSQAKRTREFVARRFPALKNQPFIETRVCQVTDSLGGNFLVDRHPDLNNVWLVGGGAGHGFKHGPAMGRYVAARVLGQSPDTNLDDLFRLKKDDLAVYRRN